MIVVKKIMVEYFLDSSNFGSRIVVVDDTPIVSDKLDRVTFAFQKEDTVARKNLSFVNLGISIWKAFGGNTRDLGSFGEETDKTTDLHQHLSRISPQRLETASQITRDADLALYDNESWNDPRDFAKSVKAITLPQDVSSIPDCRPIELENQVQCLMEAHLAPTQPTHVNKITTACEICSSPHDTQYCIEDPEQAFVKYASSRTDEARGK
ncbi:hypothetical protein Tco_0565754 [Tanacetum coccineum]